MALTPYTRTVTHRFYSVYCNDMAGTPSEYLELINTGSIYNYGSYNAGGGTEVKTSYQKVRLDPATLTVDIGDQTFASSSGLIHHGAELVTSMPYGVAMDCIGRYSQAGTANIDLSGTSLAVNDTFAVGGYLAAGVATFSQNDQVVNLRGGGYCGWITPSPPMYNPFNAQGGFRLDLKYIGPRVVQIDIKPGSDPNSINLGSNGNVPVAILGSIDFNVSNVNASSINLAGANVILIGKAKTPQVSYEDVNGDGYTDLVANVSTKDLQLSETDTMAKLTATLYDGTKIEGFDSIRIVPP